MSINLNDNLIVQAPKATDDRYGPYESEAEATSSIENIVRYQGLTAGVIVGGEVVDYWFKDGIADLDFVVKTTGGSGGTAGIVGDIGFACSDEITDLTTGLRLTFHAPYSLDISQIKLSCNSPPLGSNLIVDIKDNGTSIFTDKPFVPDGAEIESSVYTLTSAPDPYVLNVDNEVTVFIDQVGSTSAGRGLKVWLLGNKTVIV
jgi:hypothetical protein